MSITLMTAAFKAALSATNKFVLVALCDNANDQGECYPSVSMLCEKTSLSERSVQGAIAALVREKYVTRHIRNGRSAMYFVSDPRTWAVSTPAAPAPHPRSTCTPAAPAPPQEMHPTPAGDAPPPPQLLHPTPAGDAPITINEPSIEPSMNHQKRIKPISPDMPDWIPMDAWDGYIEMRKKKRKEPTARAVQLLISELEKLKAAGQNIAVVLDKSTVNGWTDVYAIKGDQKMASPLNGNSSLGPAGQATAANAKRWLEAQNAE